MANENEIDSLYLDITVKSSATNADKINSLANALDKLSRVFFDFPTATFDKVSEKLAKFSEATKATSTCNRQLTNLTSRISNFNVEIRKLDVATMKTKFDEMAIAITPFLDKVTAAQESLVALNGVMNGSNKINSQTIKSPKQTKEDGGIFRVAKWGSVALVARRLGRTVGKIAQEGANYTETLNLWETAMRGNLNVANQFVDKMNEAYGVSEMTLMNAQATFKNMLGSLGQMSDETAYILSEGVTQMALDYASLYNQTFSDAMTKFQAALAGQVRPIRSVSGFDITENTLYQLYQSLGGTKTMRQLSRTEKQLLSIYAIFHQMEASGTIGDLDKTMESFANQSRVTSEAFREIVQFSGVLLTHAIQESGLLTQLNGLLLFLGDVLKGAAEATGAIEHYGDPFASTTEGALDAIEATDELTGKLLGFDKFQALSTPQDNALNIDEKLLDALSSYDSILEGASMEAREIANSLKEASKLFDEDGVFDKDAWDDLTKNIKNFGIALGVIIAANSIPAIITNIKTLTTSTTLLSSALIGGAIYAFLEAIDAFNDGKIAIGVLSSLIGVTLVGAIIALTIKKSALAQATLFEAKAQKASTDELKKWYSIAEKGSKRTADMAQGFATLGIGLATAIGGVTSFVNAWGDMADWQKLLGILGSALAMVVGITIALTSTVSWTKAIGTSAMVAGGILSVMSAIPKFADGGLPDKGSLFIANEAGPELVANIGGGQSGVMNMEQLESAVARGMMIGLSTVDMRDDRPININIDGQRFFSASRDIYKRNGYDVSAIR